MLFIEQNQHEVISVVNDSRHGIVNTVALVDSRINSQVRNNICTTKEACGGVINQGQGQQSAICEADRYIGASTISEWVEGYEEGSVRFNFVSVKNVTSSYTRTERGPLEYG